MSGLLTTGRRLFGAAAAISLAAVVVLACGQAARAEAAKELALDLGAGAALKVTLIPAGKFTMGSPAPAQPAGGRADDEVQHQVTISKPFYMGIYEVTRAQFAAFVKGTGYKTDAEKEGWASVFDGDSWDKGRGATWQKPRFEQTDDMPAVCVSWSDGTEFCKWLSKKSGKTVRLPTEAEWEYACRAGASTAYQWGDNPDDGAGLANVADKTAKKRNPNWTIFNFQDGFALTAPAGKFKPNAWGLYDMTGNVWEWCGDWHGPYSKDAAADPIGADKGEDRVMRGGSWFCGPKYARSAYRGKNPPASRGTDIGFRIVVEAK